MPWNLNISRRTRPNICAYTNLYFEHLASGSHTDTKYGVNGRRLDETQSYSK